MAKAYRITIQLSEAEMRNLIFWARWHGKPKATYAGQVISARIEANIPVINGLLEDEAKAQGCTVDELKQRWLSEENFGQDVDEVEE
jgi:hypothetical protein